MVEAIFVRIRKTNELQLSCFKAENRKCTLKTLEKMLSKEKRRLKMIVLCKLILRVNCRTNVCLLVEAIIY